MTTQVSKEGLTDDQMNEHCHLAITEVLATPMKKKRSYLNPSFLLVNAFVDMTSETVCQCLLLKINLKCFFLKKTFYNMYRYNSFYYLLEHL